MTWPSHSTWPSPDTWPNPPSHVIPVPKRPGELALRLVAHLARARAGELVLVSVGRIARARAGELVKRSPAHRPIGW
jgi:hypothetical protein